MSQKIPDTLRYATTHEWSRLEDDGTITVGITDHAQEALGEVVYVELPELDMQFVAGDEVCVVESVKAASDIYAPVSGTIVAVNTDLDDVPEKVNESPYCDGWFFRLRPDDVGELDGLLDAEAYAEAAAVDEH